MSLPRVFNYIKQHYSSPNQLGRTIFAKVLASLRRKHVAKLPKVVSEGIEHTLTVQDVPCYPKKPNKAGKATSEVDGEALPAEEEAGGDTEKVKKALQ